MHLPFTNQKRVELFEKSYESSEGGAHHQIREFILHVQRAAQFGAIKSTQAVQLINSAQAIEMALAS